MAVSEGIPARERPRNSPRTSRRCWLRGLGASAAILALATAVPSVRADGLTDNHFGGPATLRRRTAQERPPFPVAAQSPAGSSPPTPELPDNVWGATTSGISEVVADLPPRVYVPHEMGGDVAVIDPISMQVIDRFWVGRTPHHVAPDYDFQYLYVNVMDSNRLAVIDPWTSKPMAFIPVAVPYNLYFSPDGTKAIVVAERYNRLDFHDPATWAVIARVQVPGSGADHLDFSADGSYLLVGCEFGGQIVKVGVHEPGVLGVLRGGGLPIDVKLAPDGSVFYVANQGRHGVAIVDPEAMREVGFLPTGRGAHGMAISRDTRSLYVANRLSGTISVIDFETRTIAATWWIGGSPDMLQVSPDGKQLWASARSHGSVYVVDTEHGHLVHSIRTGAAPHGLTYFPQPGRFSVGHNGVYR